MLVDGRVVGTWGRVQETLTIHPWEQLRPVDLECVEAEAETMRCPIGQAMRLRWLG